MAPSDSGPVYISSHSADVILSDIRPIKLQRDALHALNVLLDEFLYRILSAATSLATDKLRDGLLTVLPTSLGKEALLEAQVELRAYYDRVHGTPSWEDDSKTFYLPWAFELLRLKCVAFSTLNDSDEDPDAEVRLHASMSRSAGVTAPRANLVPPAALYLAAILEFTCEHILSNVGRVASRDSSRVTAPIQDLFTALCEDSTVYPLFKTMKVYEQIELAAGGPKPKRSKSLVRGEKHSISRTLSNQRDVPPTSSSESASRSRKSNESPLGQSKSSSSVHSRSSLEKTRAKIFSSGHRRSESARSAEGSRHAHSESEKAEKASLEAEFDDLMRSGDTLKVSLTPDRLRTMTPNQIKDREKASSSQSQAKSGDAKAPPSSSAPTSTPTTTSPSSSGPTRVNTRLPSPHQVDSIVEDDEEHTAPAVKPISPVPSPLPSPMAYRKPVPMYSAVANTPVRNGNSTRSHHNGASNGFSTKTRTIQRNRESMDLDEIMAGSDGDDVEEAENMAPSVVAARTPVTPRRKMSSASATTKVSATTRQLMEFLEEGPPDSMPRTPAGNYRAPLSGGMRSPGGTTTHVSRATRDMIDFLAQGPPEDFAPPHLVQSPSSDSTRSKGSGGRLQRMMSKLSMSSDRHRANDSVLSSSYLTTPVRSLSQKISQASLPYMKPVPPRMPFSPSSIYSLTDDNEGVDDLSTARSRSRKSSAASHKQIGRVDIAATDVSTMPVRPPPQYASRVAPPKRSDSLGVATNGSDDFFSAAKEGPSSRAHGTPHSAVTREVTQQASTVTSSSSAQALRTVDVALDVVDQFRDEPRPAPASATRSTASQLAKTPTSMDYSSEKSTYQQQQWHHAEKIADLPTPEETEPPTHPRGSTTPVLPPSPAMREAAVSPPPDTTPTTNVTPDDARDMRQLLSRATSADECRLIIDMFLVRAGVSLAVATPVDEDNPYPSPSPSDTPQTASMLAVQQQQKPDTSLLPTITTLVTDSSLERCVVDVFLGGDAGAEMSSTRKLRSKRNPKPAGALVATAYADSSPSPSPMPSPLATDTPSAMNDALPVQVEA